MHAQNAPAGCVLHRLLRAEQLHNIFARHDTIRLPCVPERTACTTRGQSIVQQGHSGRGRLTSWQGSQESEKVAMQVEADSSFGLLHSDAKLRRGSYRVTLQTDSHEISGMSYASWLKIRVFGGYSSVAAGSVAAAKWTPVFHMRHMSLLGYFPQVTLGSAATATAEQQQGCLQQAMPL